MSYIVDLVIENFIRYRGVFHLELETGCYAIQAEDSKDSTQSNGLGKSSLLAAIKWCLDGKKTEDVVSVDDMISHGEDHMRVCMVLSDGTRIDRRKKRDTSYALTVLANGKEYKQDDAQVAIWEVLGITFEDMETTCWAEQGELASIAKAKPTALLELVESWIGDELDKLVEAGKIVNDKLKLAVEYHEKAIAEKARLEQLGNIDKINELENYIKTQKLEYSKIYKEYERITEERTIYWKRKELKDLRVEKEELLESVKSLNSQFKKDRTPSDEVLNKKFTEQASVVNKLSNEQRDIDKECRRLKVLVENKFDGKCPVSKGFECPATKKINSRIDENLETYTKELDKYNNKTEEYDDQYSILDELSKEINNRKYEDKELSKVKGKIEQIEVLIKKIDNKIKTLVSEGIVELKDNEELPDLPDIPDTYLIKNNEVLLDNYKQAHKALPEAIRRVEDTAKDVRAYRLANALLGPEGARRKVIEGVVSQVEYDANQALNDANVGQSVKAVWGRETGQLADQCYECGSAFPSSAKVKRCEKCGSTRGPKIKHEFKWQLGFVSGSGKDTGGLGLRIGGYKWKKLNRGTTWGVAVLDEPTAQMDEFRRRALSASIRKLLVGTFEQSLITSHSKATLESCEHKILIKGNGKWSTVEVVQ